MEIIPEMPHLNYEVMINNATFKIQVRFHNPERDKDVHQLLLKHVIKAPESEIFDYLYYFAGSYSAVYNPVEETLNETQRRLRNGDEQFKDQRLLMGRPGQFAEMED